MFPAKWVVASMAGISTPCGQIPDLLIKSTLVAGEGGLLSTEGGEDSWLGTMVDNGETSREELVVRPFIDWLREYCCGSPCQNDATEGVYGMDMELKIITDIGRHTDCAF